MSGSRDREKLVIAGTDGGFGTWVGQAAVVPDIAWAKLQSLAEGARRATQEFG
jgi:5-methyltetrahydropteroyltriglutamate--homocysteine methyltransferase